MTDTTARDQLAELLADDWSPDRDPILTAMFRDYAQTILDAGWRPPAHTVTTVEELDALAVGAIIMEGDHGTPDDTGWGFKTMPGVLHRFPEGWHVVAGDGERVPDLPATVLYEPEEAE